MKKVLILTFMVPFIAVASIGPSEINLRETWGVQGTRGDVIFKHEFHQDNNSCTDCHKTDEGGKFKPEGEIKGMTNKNAAHKFCWTCHQSKHLPAVKRCDKCHTK
ncbi:cytochrome c3 [Denitrovibrio acetiphilus DSM 12809]|jgi:c(7)-type cytochrome triheme protein|uniref:Cytochrome c3 n=1 Tax=Denitrovibrio acetiphilus (strain DSM 12809 / NBRC 114555 / N2460) TaxID=522772 RepID=D4H672_DENA2|nr:cytochrome c3 family protein [Denitrovibrio acetiphilus]ADD67718.1 cytochrome c3 [Denitrovibrio acetiphilus DSM 12809]